MRNGQKFLAPKKITGSVFRTVCIGESISEGRWGETKHQHPPQHPNPNTRGTKTPPPIRPDERKKHNPGLKHLNETSNEKVELRAWEGGGGVSNTHGKVDLLLLFGVCAWRWDFKGREAKIRKVSPNLEDETTFNRTFSRLSGNSNGRNRKKEKRNCWDRKGVEITSDPSRSRTYHIQRKMRGGSGICGARGGEGRRFSCIVIEEAKWQTFPTSTSRPYGGKVWKD